MESKIKDARDPWVGKDVRATGARAADAYPDPTYQMRWLNWCLKERAYKWSTPDAESFYEYGTARWYSWHTRYEGYHAHTYKGFSVRGGRKRTEFNTGFLKDFMGEYACGGSFFAPAN